MINPLQKTVSFTGLQEFKDSVVNKKPEIVDTKQVAAPVVKNEDVVTIQNAAPAKKPSLKERFLGLVKGYNKVTRTTGGFVKGLADGALLAGVAGFIGRNIHKSKEYNYNIGKIIGGMFKDAGKIVSHVVTKTIPHLITKSPIENLKNFKAPFVTFYNKCMKGNKATGAVALALFAGALAFRTIQGKMIANKRNADVDHYTGNKH